MEKRDTFVKLPDYVPAGFRTTHVGKLRMVLHGTRPAAALWRDELIKGLVSCNFTVGTVWRCCFHKLRFVTGTVHGDDIFVAGPRQDVAKMGATLKKRWETRDQMIGPKPDDQKELRSINRTLRWCKGGLVFAANLRHGREVVDELVLSKSKPVSSPAAGDGVNRCKDDESKPLDEEEKRLYPMARGRNPLCMEECGDSYPITRLLNTFTTGNKQATSTIHNKSWRSGNLHPSCLDGGPLGWVPGQCPQYTRAQKMGGGCG